MGRCAPATRRADGRSATDERASRAPVAFVFCSIKQRVGLARQVATNVLEHTAGIDLNTARLLVGELASNAVLHGESGWFSLLIEWRAGGVRITVSDGGCETQVPGLRDDLGEWDDSGRGLSLVAALAEDWGVESEPDRTSVWCYLAAEAA